MTSSSRASDWYQPWLEWWPEMGDLAGSCSWVGLTRFGFSSLSPLLSFPFSPTLSLFIRVWGITISYIKDRKILEVKNEAQKL